MIFAPRLTEFYHLIAQKLEPRRTGGILASLL